MDAFSTKSNQLCLLVMQFIEKGFLLILGDSRHLHDTVYYSLLHQFSYSRAVLGPHFFAVSMELYDTQQCITSYVSISSSRWIQCCTYIFFALPNFLRSSISRSFLDETD